MTSYRTRRPGRHRTPSMKAVSRRAARSTGLRYLKQKGFEVKNHNRLPGSIRAAVVTFGVVDHHGDIVAPGSLRVPEKGVMVSKWNHSALKGGPTIGTARLWEEGDRIMAEVFLDDTPDGKLACERITREKPEWSIGYIAKKTRAPNAEEESRGAKRIILSMIVGEISPVDKGAQIGQGTFAACCGSCAVNIPKFMGPQEDCSPHPHYIPPWQKRLPREVRRSLADQQAAALVRERRRELYEAELARL